MQAFGDQFLAGPAFADDKHRTLHRGRAAGTLDRIEESPGLADELVFPLHPRDIANCTDSWQHPPSCAGNTVEKLAELRRARVLAQPLLNTWQQHSGGPTHV